MPNCLKRASIPKVRASSGTIGTTLSPIDLSLSSLVSNLTKIIVVDCSLSTASSKDTNVSLLALNFSFETFLRGINPPNAFLLSCK